MWMVEQIEDIKNRYESGSTTKEIANVYGKSAQTINNLLRKHGVEIRKGIRRSKLKNSDYFKTIDTPAKAYFLGLMISDGMVFERTCKTRTGGTYEQRGIRITLHDKDRYILEEFDKELGSDGTSVKHTKGRNESVLVYTNEEMFHDLARYGVIPNKSLVAYIPDIPEELMPHLIRGIFDGDGTVYMRTVSTRMKVRLEFGFCGTYKVCEQVRDYLVKEIDITSNAIVTRKEVENSQVVFSKVKDTQAFYDLIYKDADHYLHRKKDKFEEFFSLYANTEVS